MFFFVLQGFGDAVNQDIGAPGRHGRRSVYNPVRRSAVDLYLNLIKFWLSHSLLCTVFCFIIFYLFPH
jgi:hypothetical protein